MSSARENILKRLRAAGSYPASAARSNWHPPRYDQEARLTRFKTALSLSHAEIIETTEADWAQQLIQLATSRNLKKWLYSAGSMSGSVFGAKAAAQASSMELTAYDQPVESIKAPLFHDIEASFTEVQAGIAETGTLVILPGKAEPRLMSLVPPVHVALFRTSTLLSSFSELIEQQGWATQGLPTNALLISGPSKTADIQQTLAYGAHGPKALIVLLINDNSVA